MWTGWPRVSHAGGYQKIKFKALGKEGSHGGSWKLTASENMLSASALGAEKGKWEAWL